MKIRVNAIGLGESKFIILSEALILSGIVATSVGLVLLRKTQCWSVANSEHHFEYFNAVVETLNDAFSKK